ARYPLAPAHLHADAAGARNLEAAGGRQFREGDCRDPGFECEDRGSAQVQPHAQARHSQQSPAGYLRNPEKDHQDSRQPLNSLSSRSIRGARGPPRLRVGHTALAAPLAHATTHALGGSVPNRAPHKTIPIPEKRLTDSPSQDISCDISQEVSPIWS